MSGWSLCPGSTICPCDGNDDETYDQMVVK